MITVNFLHSDLTVKKYLLYYAQGRTHSTWSFGDVTTKFI